MRIAGATLMIFGVVISMAPNTTGDSVAGALMLVVGLVLFFLPAPRASQ